MRFVPIGCFGPKVSPGPVDVLLMNTGILNRNLAAKRVGMYVRERRRHLGLSRAELARRLGFVLGSVVSHVERGAPTAAPSGPRVRAPGWARALELEPATFAGDLAALSGAMGASEDSLSLTRPAWA